MPTRMLRDWTDSERIDALSAGAETLFVRLLMKVDDYGRFVAKPRLLIAACYPLKTNLSEKQVSCWTDELNKAGLVTLYKVDGKAYLQVERFSQRLRAKHSRYPGVPASSLPDKCPTYDGHMTGICPPETETETETRDDEPLIPPLVEPANPKKCRKATREEHDAAVKNLVEPLTEPWKGLLLDHCAERRESPKHPPHTERSLRMFIDDLKTWPPGLAEVGLKLAIKRQWRVAERSWVEKEMTVADSGQRTRIESAPNALHLPDDPVERDARYTRETL